MDPPSELVVRSVCALSGLVATDACPAMELERLPAGGARPRLHLAPRGGGRVAVAWPARYRAWARARGLLDEHAPPPPREHPPGGLRLGRESEPLRIVSPPAGAVYLRDPRLRAPFQTLPLRAVAEGPGRRLQWEIDGEPVGASTPETALDWPLEPGRHTVVVKDERGRQASTTIVVK